MTRRGGGPSEEGGHAEARRRQFERSRGLGGDRESAGEGLAGKAPVRGGKTYLRQEEFRARRGLRADPRDPMVDRDAGLVYLRGSERKEELAAAGPDAPNVAWRSLGPDGISGGQTYGSGPGSTTTAAGRVTAVAVDPSNSQHLLIGSAAGGIWESLDTGATWAPRTDGQRTLSIGALAFDRGNPSNVYAGTGEGNSEYGYLGQGVLRSQDGGSTWTLLASDFFVGQGFYRLVVDPHNGARLLAATTGGAAVSTDSGESWTTLFPGRAWDISLADTEPGGPAEREILVAKPEGLFGVGGAVAPGRRTLPGLPPSLDPEGERMAVVHVPVDPSQAFVFAAFGGEAHLWHRPAGSQLFEPVPLPNLSEGENVPNVFSVEQASYDWYAAVPPNGDDILYLGAIELVKGERSGTGWNWSDISSRQQQGDSIHADQHAMAFDPRNSNTIYAGNDGGIFRSPDGGVSWQSLNAGLGISEVEYLTVRPDNPIWILAGLQDNGTIRREGEGEWAQVAPGDGGDCATNMAVPATCFHSYHDMALERSTSGGDRGSWQDITPPGAEEIQRLFYPPLEVDGSLVAWAGDVVYLSVDNGENWSAVQLPAAADGEASVASAISIYSTEILVGTIHGDIFKIRSERGIWSTPYQLASPAQGWISDIFTSSDHPGRYWLTYSQPGLVFRSDDWGQSWVDVTTNLPAIPVNAVVGQPGGSDRVWVACDVGVFESSNGGAAWSLYGTGLPNALAEDLVVDPVRSLLRVATRSRGVWEADIVE